MAGESWVDFHQPRKPKMGVSFIADAAAGSFG